jgi:hypothetical protein
VLRWEPTHIGAHLKLVETHRRLFDIVQRQSDDPMAVIQIGDAVFNEPQFRSRPVLDEWLSRAIGPHLVHLQACLDHLKTALRLCPLEGRAYIHAAELSFLWAPDREGERACIDQAVRVRPFDGAVLYAMANQAILAGNEPLWREGLKRAYHYGREQQQKILTDRVAAAPPESLPTVIADILNEFQPDLQNADFLYSLCAKRCSPQQLTPLTQYRAETAEAEAFASQEDAETAVWLWCIAGRLHRELRDGAKAIQCARNALRCVPADYDAHCLLGQLLLRQSQFAEAEENLRWCLQRTPGNREVENLVREALKGRLDDERRAAKTPEDRATR